VTWKTEKLPALVGVAEACEILGVQKMTFKRWRDDGYFDIKPADPGPKQGPVWVADDVRAWGEKNGRLRQPAGAAAAAAGA
jgi:hypothetical protein